MYRSSELSLTKNDPSRRSDSFASASSKLSDPQYQPHCDINITKMKGNDEIAILIAVMFSMGHDAGIN